jgi:hypothetical protein
MKKIFLISTWIISAASLHAQVQTNSDLKTLINQSFSYFPKIKEVENGISTAQEKLDDRTNQHANMLKVR